jgi:hypothetical protein
MSGIKELPAASSAAESRRFVTPRGFRRFQDVLPIVASAACFDGVLRETQLETAPAR